MSCSGIYWAFGALILVNLPPFLMAATLPAERNLAFAVQGARWPFFGFVGNLVGVTTAEAAPYRLALLLASAIDCLTVLLIGDLHLIGSRKPIRCGGANF